MIETRELSKRYGQFTAVDAISFKVEPGQVLGFLGPNGAGKSTTMKMLAGFLAPSAGSATVAGFDVQAQPLLAKRALGYLPEGAPSYGEMTVREFLDFIASVRGLAGDAGERRIDEVIARLHLERVLEQPIDTLSKGFKRRVGLAGAILHDPKVLILDEPTDGLDPLIQRAFEAHLLDRHAAGRTIFMSSHDLGEVDRLCQTVAIVRGGHLVQEASIQELRASHRRRAEIVLPEPLPPGTTIPGAEVIGSAGRTLSLLVDLDPNPLLGFLAERNVESVTIAPPSLNDIFAGYYARESQQP